MECKKETDSRKKNEEVETEPHDILEEIEVEDLTVDGICGVY
jgi:mycofactocin precursor